MKLINGARWVDTSVYRRILLGCGFWVVFLLAVAREPVPAAYKMATGSVDIINVVPVPVP